MRPIDTDGVARSVCESVCLSVCLLDTFMSPARTDKRIEMPFGWVTRVGPGNQVLQREGVFLGVRAAH